MRRSIATETEPANETIAPLSERRVVTRRPVDLAPLGIAISALTESWLGTMTYDDKRRYAATLLARECVGGGFEGRAGEGCSLEATAVYRAALRACGVGDSSFVVRRAEAKIRALGGYDALRAQFVSRRAPEAILCAMMGLVSADSLSGVMGLVDVAASVASGDTHSEDPLWSSACLAVCDRFLVKRGKPSLLAGTEKEATRRKLVAALASLQHANGSWGSAIDRTAFALITLDGLGIDPSDARVERALDWLERRKTRGRDGLALADDLCE